MLRRMRAPAIEKSPRRCGRRRPSLAAWLALGLAACGTSPPSPPPFPNGTMPVEPPLRAGCNPLGGGPGEDCFTPYPSSFYTVEHAGGLRVSIPPGVLPVSRKAGPLEATAHNTRDGFSPATPILVYFPALPSTASGLSRIDGSSLPRPHQPETALSPRSPVQLFDFATGERVPILAELDQNAAEGERQALIVYPQVRLRPKARYVVAVRGLRRLNGAPVAPLSGFAALRDDQLLPTGPRAAQKARYAELFAFLAKQGLPRAELQAAWDFPTGSDEQLVGRMLRMRDLAFAQLGPMMTSPALIKIQTVKESPRPELARQIIAWYLAPSFLTDDVNGRLRVGADGTPLQRGLGQFPLVIHIPACATTTMAPLPVVLYGHGLFGSAQGELDTSYQREIGNRLCMVQIGTDWIGLSSVDRGYVATSVLTDFNNLVQLTDRLQQAHINFAFLSRLIQFGILDELPELRVSGRLVIDRKRIYYYGISNGGIQGLTALALSPHLQRGALTVPGGFWSQMMWRSSNFGQLATLLSASYPDPLDRQLLVALSQAQWDYTDPATYAPYVQKAPLAGSGGPKPILYQEGIGDAQVPNLATRSMVRTLGLTLLNQPVEAVFGVGQQTGPLDSAYVQFDIGQLPRPGETNVPPEKDNPVHGAVARLEAAKQQLAEFLRDDGRVNDTCVGKPCQFPPP